MKKVVFSQRAYLSMLAEVYERVETETGGILLGHREGDTWYVLESVEPGPKSIFTPTYFEYDDGYVTYRANKLSRLYKCSINLLGLWHRHPSLMKTFSSTDDGTNKIYSDMLNGAISGIVTLGNGFEITMYYVPSNVRYERIEWVIDDSLIPERYLSYYSTEYYKNLINDAAQRTYGARVCHTSRPENTNSTYYNSNPSRADSSKIPKDRPVKKGILETVIEKIADTIYNMFEEVEDEYDNDEHRRYSQDNDNYENEFAEESDIAFIFDTIEPDIAYLQQLETEGKFRWEIEKKKDRNGKDGLILNILDLRDNEQDRYRLIFYVANDQVVVKDDEGNVRHYRDNFISLILGGKK